MTPIITNLLSVLTVIALVFSVVLLLDMVILMMTKKSAGVIPAKIASAVRVQTVP
jgi:hypothetical protein